MLWQLWLPHTNLHIVLNKCLLNWKAWKITQENNLPFFFLLWNCSTLSECSRTDSLHCNPSLWRKNQLSHIRAGCSEDKLPGMRTGTRPDTSAEGPLLLCHPQPFSSSLSWPRPRSPMEGTTDHPRTGSGSPGKAYKSQRYTICTTSHFRWRAVNNPVASMHRQREWSPDKYNSWAKATSVI